MYLRSALFLRSLLLVALLAPWLAVAAAPAGMPFANSDLPVDPTVTWGRLDNGLRYALMPNHEPKGRASLRFAVAAGSLNESEAQRGLAHFLEHLAFNGSTHFPPGTLVEYFQRLGMSFGGDTNAFTSFDRTVYMLELPDTKSETFEKAFTLFADYGGGLLLEPASIDKERGIILSEKRARDSVGYRQFVGEFEYLLPESRLPQRLPIGLEPVINTAQRDLFADFYDTWYRPDLITVVAVGDFDPATVEAQIRKALSSLTARAPARPAPSLGRVAESGAMTTRFLPEPDAPAVHLSLQTISPYAYEADTAANRLKYLPRSLALRMLNRRFSILAKKEGAPFLSGLVGATEQYDFYRNTSVELTCRPEQWKDALATGEQELRRALQFGFQPAELQEAVANQRNELDQAVRTASTRQSGQLAEELVDSFVDRNTFTHPSTELALFTPVLDKLTVNDCVAALREAWNDKLGRRLFVTGNLQLEDAEKQILAAYDASHAVVLQPPARTADVAFAYNQFGAPGEIARRAEVADLGITQLEFKNGVRLNLKPTDFEAGRIRINIRVGGGKLSLPAGQTGLDFLTSNTLLLGGLGKHSPDELQRLLAGRTVGSNFSVANDAFVFGGTTNRTDLQLQLQLLCAYLTDPGYRPESLSQIQRNLGPFYTRLARTVEGPLQTEVPRLLAAGDSRFGIPPLTALSSRTLAEMRSWLTPEFAHGAMEIAVVGDFDPAATISAVAGTFGSLPARTAKPAYIVERKVSFPAAPLAQRYTVPTEIPKGLVSLFWPATDSREVHLSRRLNLLASVLDDRLRVKIREQMGGTYSPQAGANLSETFPGYGYLVAQCTVAPEQARTIADAIRTIAADLHAKGVTEEELERAKQPMLTAIKESIRTNPYWLGNVLASAQEQPERIEWSRTRLSDTTAITAAELTALAKQYLDPDRVNEFISVPAEKPAAEAKPEAKPATAPAPAAK